MRIAKFLLPLGAALALAACARQQQTYYVVDPQTGQPVPVVQQYTPPQQYAGPAQYVQAQAGQQQYANSPRSGQSGSRGLFGSPQAAQQAYAPQYAQPVYQPPSHAAAAICPEHGPRPVQFAPQCAAAICGAALRNPSPTNLTCCNIVRRRPRAPHDGRPLSAGALRLCLCAARLSAALHARRRRQTARLVFGQEGICGSYMVDAGGNVNLPLVGTVPARGYTTQALVKMIARAAQAGLCARAACDGGDREPTGRSSSSARSPRPANIRLRAQHDGGERRRGRRRVFAARQEADGRVHPQRAAASVLPATCRSIIRCSPATPSSSRSGGSSRLRLRSHCHGRGIAVQRTACFRTPCPGHLV